MRFASFFIFVCIVFKRNGVSKYAERIDTFIRFLCHGTIVVPCLFSKRIEFDTVKICTRI